MHRSGRRAALLVACLVLLAGCGRYANVIPGQPPSPAHGPAVHVVSTGETLYSISWQHGYDYHRVAEWNGINPPFVIQPGQRIRLTPPAAIPQGREPRQEASVKKVRTAAPPAGTSERVEWRWPTQGVVVKTFNDDARSKKGIEIAGALGQPVNAAADGRVVYSGDGLTGYGNLVIIRHDDTFLSAYAFNSRLLVEENDSIRGGQTIAEMGAYGGKPRLHFEVRRQGRPVDPLRYLPPQ